MSESTTQEAPRKNVRLVVGLVLLVGVFYLLVNSMMSSGAYFVSVAEANARRLDEGRPIRVKGTVVTGSYHHEQGTTVHSFRVKDKEGPAELSVYYDGPMPDVFSEGREVVVEGPRRADGVLAATEVTAKCPSKYEGGQMTDTAKERLEERPGS
ncbi:MAG: cytochrome c maturation protein CcmE [Myxococcales bacterium]|nr:cytochrome c maturation protein CcmE [Myxococcales bacterium]MCB9544579.1 cytochrome c maturation protein CcmE [Myxococcales bacterium]